MPSPSRPPGSRRIASFGETVFTTFSRLAAQTGAINLGQGFPDFEPPAFALEALRAAATGFQQYPPLAGVHELLEEIAHDAGLALSRHLDPLANVQITVGATEGLFAAVQALVDPGDEVVIFEPFYDAYPADVVMAGGVPRYVPLRPQVDGAWAFDETELRRAFGDRTRLVLLNTPHNPTGKVFTRAELDLIVELAARHDAWLLSDEVYEHIAFTPHTRIAEVPGGFERTLTLSSLGKTFSVTGWKVGWAVGPEGLIRALRTAHQWIPFTVATPLQRAAAQMLRLARDPAIDYYAELATSYLRRRDRLVADLDASPFEPLVPEGGTFVMARSDELGYPDDMALCLDLPRRAGVVAIPPGAFYSEDHKVMARSLVRFAFCKDEAALEEAGARLRTLRPIGA